MTMDLRESRVLITGGAGFLGHQLTLSLIAAGCEHVVIYSRDEHKHEAMLKKFESIGQTRQLRFILGDVCDPDRLRWAMRGCDYVVHAAALKIVPALQYNPMAAVDVNVNGWRNVARAAIDNQVPIKIVGISTDKAVMPINTYGKAKAIGEDLFLAANVYSPHIKFSCVRYGNVIGSTSSLLEGLGPQLERPKLTHREMSRFWITVKDAADLVLYALEHMVGQEIFVPKCRSAWIRDVLRVVTGKTEYDLTGMRPGEKLWELLIHEYEWQRTIEQDNYYIILPENPAHELPYECPKKDMPGWFASNGASSLMTEEELRGVFKHAD
jgi:UDP-N-acetylglucosamine 4,6-dehydratase